MELYEQNCPTGIYNVTNEGGISTCEVVELIREILKPNRNFEFFENDEEFYREAKTPRSNCVLNIKKIESIGIHIRPVKNALNDSLKNWVKNN